MSYDPAGVEGAGSAGQEDIRTGVSNLILAGISVVGTMIACGLGLEYGLTHFNTAAEIIISAIMFGGVPFAAAVVFGSMGYDTYESGKRDEYIQNTFGSKSSKQ